MSRFPLIGCALCLIVFGGCAVGPQYKPPTPTVPTTWSEAQDSGTTTQPADLTQWWTTFHDPTLDMLIAQAAASNLELRLAAARVREARAMRGVVAAGKQPQLQASGSYTHSRRSANALSTPASPSSSGAAAGAASTGAGSVGSGTTGGAATGSLDRDSDLFQLGFDARWELDLFGGVRRNMEAAEAEIDAAVEERRAVLVTLLSEVARNYVELRSAQAQQGITRTNLAAQEDTLHLTRVRFDAGLSSQLDVARAEALVAGTASQLPPLERTARQALHRLSVLLGQEPGALLSQVAPTVTIPAPTFAPTIGLPVDLLARRPDIRRAERALAAATARVGVAVAERYPRLSLSALLGQQSLSLSNLFAPSSLFLSVGPALTWPVFDAGRIRANIQVQDARQEQALVRYEQAVLTALEEVENALVAYGQEQERRRALRTAVDANRRAVTQATELYTKGLVDFLNVLEAQRTLLAAESQLAQSDATVAAQVVALYKALGGGWETPGLPTNLPR